MSTKSLQDVIAQLADNAMRAENDVIERDLIELFEGYSVVYQAPPEGGTSVYRGIAFQSRLIIDHSPGWPGPYFDAPAATH